jgi:hypothetical protein
VRGMDDATREGSHRFWIANPDRSFSECWVNEKAESRIGLENQLDNPAWLCNTLEIDRGFHDDND